MNIVQVGFWVSEEWRTGIIPPRGTWEDDGPTGSSGNWTPGVLVPKFPVFSSREWLLLFWRLPLSFLLCLAYGQVEIQLYKNPAMVWMSFSPQKFMFWELGPWFEVVRTL